MIVQLPQAKINFTVLKQGEIVLGEILDGGATSYAEIKEAMISHGLKHGHRNDFIEKLAAGYRGQLPIATSIVRVELVKFNIEFFDDTDIDAMAPYEFLASLHAREISGLVKEGDPLLTINSTSKRILLKPDGTEIILSDAGAAEINHFFGKNVHISEDGKAILSDIEGVAQITTRGLVSVYPFEAHKNIGKVHGAIDTDQALLVEEDITSGAKISSEATLIVQGTIRASTIHCGGDLDCQSGLENHLKEEDCDVRVQQNLRTSSIKHFNVWVGGKLYASRIIDQSVVEVLDTLACPRIADSRISVGHRLIAYNIVRDCQIKFGPNAVEDPIITKFRQAHLARSRRHHDIHLDMEYQAAHLDQLRQKALLIIRRLKTEGQSTLTVGNVLKRYLNNMGENFTIYRNAYKELVEIEKIVRQERAELAYHASLLESFANPKIIVVGKMESGTKLIGPVDSLVLNKSMNNVEVSLDPSTRKMVFKQLNAE
jgi:hypothetical protein